eukprot:6781053-Prymnesium_polylepis.1
MSMRHHVRPLTDSIMNEPPTEQRAVGVVVDCKLVHRRRDRPYHVEEHEVDQPRGAKDDHPLEAAAGATALPPLGVHCDGGRSELGNRKRHDDV